MADNTTMQNTKKEMTVQEAQEILKANSFIGYSYEELLEAVRLLRNDPTQKDLVEGFYEHYYASFEGKEITAEEYLELREIFAGSNYEQELKQRIDEQNRDSEVEEILLDSEIQIDSELFNQNAAEIDRIISAENAPREFWENPQMAELAKAISFPQEDKNGNVVEADDEQKQAYLESIYYSAAAQVMQDNLNNSDFAALSKEQKAEYIKKEIATQASTDILTMYIATGVSNTLVREKLEEIVPDLPKAPESKNPTKEEIDGYNKALSSKLMEAMKDPKKAEEIAAKFNNAMETVAKAEGKIKISPMQLMANQTDKQVDLGIKSRRLFKVSKEESVDVRKTAIILRRYENKLSEIGKRLHGKVYNFAVGVKEFAHNKPGKALETLGQLVITGGNMGMAAMGWFGHGGGSAVAGTLAGVMIVHTFAKGAAYPVYNEWQKLKNDEAFRKLNWWQKYKTARKIAKEKDPDLNGHLIVGSVALVAWGVGNMALGPMGGKIAASATIALGNAIMKQREFNRVKKLYKLTGEEKYRQELYGDKSKPTKGFWGKVQKLMGSKKTQTTMAWVGALAGGLGVASQIYKHAHETAEVVTSLSSKNLDHIPTSRADSLAQGGIKADSLQQGIKADSLAQGGIKADSLQQGIKADSLAQGAGVEAQPVDVSANNGTAANVTGTEATVDAPEAEAPQVETPAAPQVGDEIFHKDHGNGIVETRVLGENGMAYQQVSGLKGGIETSDSVQAFYEHRIHNMNQYNNLMKMLPNEDGNIMTVDEAVDAMLEQFDHGFVKLPEGMTPEHAIHTAFMHAHYTGDMSAIEALRCPDGKWDTVEMFEKLAPKYSTDNGFIGRPVDPDAKLIMRAGTVEMKTPCEVSEGQAIEETIVKKNMENVGRDVGFDNQIKKANLAPIEVVPEAPSEPIVIDKLMVSYAAEPEGAQAEYPSAFAGKGTYPKVGDEVYGYRIDAIDHGDNGLTAKQVSAPDDRLGLKLTDGDRARLTVESKVEGVPPATQDSRFLNIRDPYTGVDSETVTKAAADLGGKPEEIITVTDDMGKTTYQYISSEGIKMTIDPENGSMGVTTLDGKGAPQDVQVEAANRAVKALNASEEANVKVKQMETPTQESAFTKITTKVKGNKVLQSIYARFSGGRS